MLTLVNEFVCNFLSTWFKSYNQNVRNLMCIISHTLNALKGRFQFFLKLIRQNFPRRGGPAIPPKLLILYKEKKASQNDQYQLTSGFQHSNKSPSRLAVRKVHFRHNFVKMAASPIWDLENFFGCQWNPMVNEDNADQVIPETFPLTKGKKKLQKANIYCVSLDLN